MESRKTRLPVLRWQRTVRGSYGYAIFDGVRCGYGKDEARARLRFDEDLARWLSNGRSFPELDAPASVTVRELVERWQEHVRRKHGPAWFSKSGTRAHYAAQTLVELFGTAVVADFGPRRLKAVRQSMLSGGRLCRREINARVNYVKAIFRWGASEELVPPGVWHGVHAVEALGAREFGARENPTRNDVAWWVVEATLPFVPFPLDAVVMLLWLTGARPSEILGLRPRDFDRSSDDDLWTVKLVDHKTAHHGKPRVLAFTSEAQAILAPFLLGRPQDRRLFRPVEALAALHARRRGEALPPSYLAKVRADLERMPGELYEHRALRRAVVRAVGCANPHRVGGAPDVPCWTPHQLRHALGTRVARALGRDAAQTALGHATPRTTERYTHAHEERVKDIFRKLGGDR